MSEQEPNGMLGGLPQSRPHRRSAKRPAKPAVRIPPTPAPPPSSTDGVLGTAVQAAAELAEIGLSASARALRGVLSRLPRP